MFHFPLTDERRKAVDDRAAKRAVAFYQARLAQFLKLAGMEAIPPRERLVIYEGMDLPQWEAVSQINLGYAAWMVRDIADLYGRFRK